MNTIALVNHPALPKALTSRSTEHLSSYEDTVRSACLNKTEVYPCLSEGTRCSDVVVLSIRQSNYWDV